MIKTAIFGIFLYLTLPGIADDELPLKQGFYYTGHGHAALLIELQDGKATWYRDNTSKAWGRGTYKINDVDSTVEISLDRIWVSHRSDRAPSPTSSWKIEWSSEENIYVLSHYIFRDPDEGINSLIKRVKSNCKIKIKP